MQIAHDDDSGRGLNAKIIQELQPGTYYLRIRHFRPRGQGKYVVSVKSGA
jgi:tyrosinase